MMPIYIFCDIDGVMHPIKAENDFNQGCMSALHDALQQLDGKVFIVISSSWREMYPMDYIKSQFGSLTKYVVGATSIREHRADEIIEWMKENAHQDDMWIAIDDEKIPFVQRDVHHHLLETSSETGFTRNDIQRLIELSKSMK